MGQDARAWRRPAPVFGVEDEGLALLQHRRASPPKAPTRSFGPCRSARMRDRPAVTSPRRSRIASTCSRRRSRGRWLMLRRKTSAPASNSLRDHLRRVGGGPERGDDLGASRARLIGCHPRRAVRIGELDRPALLLAGVDLEEAAAVEAAGEAILDPADREFAVARAHEGAPGPLAAAVVVDRVDIVEAGRERRPSAGSRSRAALRFHQPSVTQPCGSR